MLIPVDPDFNAHTPLFWTCAVLILITAYAASLV
jgi:hypothetical protein